MTDIKKQLKNIAGADNVLDAPHQLQPYAGDQSFVEPCMPELAVRVERVSQVQEVLRLANRTQTAVTPFSSGLNLHGAAIPLCGGIVLDLSGMDSIVQINEQDRFAIIEPGVTYAALQDALEACGLRLMVPFGVPPRRSVLTSYLERDVVMAAANQEYGTYLTHDTELVLPDGELLRTGCWNLGGRPGGMYGPGLNMLYRVWTGAQGTLGIVTKMVISVQHLSAVRRFFFLPFQSIEEIPEVLKAVQHREIGWECVGLNRQTLAALLNPDWDVPETYPARPVPSGRFEQLKQGLPPWTVTVGITGLTHFPEDWVHIQAEALQELGHKLGFSVASSLPGAVDLEDVLLRESLRPWGVLRKFHFKGSVHDLMFKVPLKKLPEVAGVIDAQARAGGYAQEEVGGYFAVIERGRALHCEFDLHSDRQDAQARESARTLWRAASETLMEHGALFDRPYGDWAPMSYSRAPQYFSKLKQLKGELDPRGLLNPGKLGFPRVAGRSQAL